MKKILFSTLILSLTFNFIGCNLQFTKKYNDGTYIGESIQDNSIEKAIVTIKDDKIVDIYLIKLDENGKEIDYKDWNSSPNLNNDRISIIDSIIEQQNTNIDIDSTFPDVVTNWKLSIDDALEKAKK